MRVICICFCFYIESHSRRQTVRYINNCASNHSHVNARTTDEKAIYTPERPAAIARNILFN